VYELESESHEYDFLVGRFPVKWMTVENEEGIPSDVQISHRSEGKNGWKIPSEYDGLRSGDRVLLTLGGSGDYFAYALSLRGQSIGAKVLRIPAFYLKSAREERSKDEDAGLLIDLFATNPEYFIETTPADRDLISIQWKYRSLVDARKARIACQQRLKQRVIGEIFCSSEGWYEAGSLELWLKDAEANDVTLKSLIAEEARCAKAVEQTLDLFPIWTQVLAEVKGCGPKIAARIISGIGDVRRFPNKSKFKSYCGVGLRKGKDGNFGLARRSRGQVANWNAEVRQGLYLLMDQFIKNPDSPWGIRFKEIKAQITVRHPEPVVVDGKKRYSKGHIHKMAIWRTATKFAEWLYKEWSKIEAGSVV
jgi:hypothetical protein